MRHFVLLFSEREGSSVMVNSLGRHPRIVVPFFETLDHYRVSQDVPEAHWGALPEVLDRVLRTGRYTRYYFAEAGTPAAEEDAAAAAAATASHNRHIVFKWRPWGEASRLGPVLARHDAGVHLLLRRDMLNWSLSLYFTSHVAQRLTGIEIQRHPQFQIAAMPPEERDAFLRRIRSEVFPVEIDRLAGIMRHQLGVKRNQLAFVEALARAGVAVQAAFYEDYLADGPGFLGHLIAPLGLEVVDAMRHSKFEKVSRDDMMQQVSNAEAVAESATIRGILRDWAALCDAAAAD